MNHSYFPHVRRNTIISLGLVLIGIYTLHITPAFPGPNSLEVPSILARMLVISGIFLFACACFIEAATLVRLFEPSALRLGSPEHIQDFAMVLFGVTGIVATIYATIYVLMPTLDVVWPWLALIIAAGSSALAVGHWASTHKEKLSFN